MSLKSGLYVTATPIGNLKDITIRAVETLREADIILCEDTRQTAKLCAAYDITTPRRPYHDHNGEQVRPGILERLAAGDAICLVSDAGTPLISDPGYKLVAEAAAAGIDVFTIPGPAACIAALSIAGLPSDKFFFAGFAPAKAKARADYIKSLGAVPATLIFYETPARLIDMLGELDRQFPERSVVVARELTKLHEEAQRGLPADLIHHFGAASAKGEIVVLVEPPHVEQASADDLDDFLRGALDVMSVRDAAAAASEATGVPKKQAYNRAIELSKNPQSKT